MPFILKLEENKSEKRYSLLAATILAGGVSGILASQAQAVDKTGFVTENGMTVYYDRNGQLVHG
ncbi:hypothetical protein [Lactobacillus delbrueckii]|uniref:hypothetical protein n=1 Tax=Lactobacillus delbrueckii TaxID=1584 RepID=UPI001F46A5D3|nr:hypothetical protein [Lactobacillus delbrueckii]GHN13937.1 hypothetical protein NRIC0767_01980 [Lactobacillus delbrueckii subsp. sunkii]